MVRSAAGLGLAVALAVSLGSHGNAKFSGQESGTVTAGSPQTTVSGLGKAPRFGTYQFWLWTDGGSGPFTLQFKDGSQIWGNAAVSVGPEPEDRRGYLAVYDGSGAYAGASGTLWWYAELATPDAPTSTYTGTLYGYLSWP